MRGSADLCSSLCSLLNFQDFWVADFKVSVVIFIRKKVMSMCIEPPRTHIRCWISVFSLRPDEVQLLAGWKLVLLQEMFCSRESTNYLMIHQNEKCIQNFIRQIWDRSSAPTKGTEKLHMRDSDYRNHQIFTPRCINNGIIPVSIRLKNTVRTRKVRKIIMKVERNLLQARVKSINSLLDNNNKQRDLCRSELASIVSNTTMEQCQELIGKVREFSYLKIGKDK